MTTHRRGAALVTFVGSLAVLVGIPVVLMAAAGWPLPRALPSVTEISRALDEGWRPEGTTLLRAVATLAWLAWGQLALTTVFEVGAQLRNRPSATMVVPLSHWCRPLAVRFAAALVTLIGTIGPRPLPAAAHQMPTVAVVVSSPASAPPQAPVPAAVSTGVMSAATLAAQPETAASGPVQVVRPGDTLWRLADEHLGDPLRWRELWELNRDRVQPDGRCAADPDLLRPGWHIALPAVAPSSSALAPVAAATMAVGEVTRTAVGAITPPSPAAPPVPAEPPAPTGATGFTMPSDGSPGPRPTPTVPPSESDTAPRDGTSDADDGRQGRTPLPAGVPSLVAGAVIGYLTALLRQRERWRRPGHRFPKPPPELTQAERQVRAAADLSAPGALDAALRHLAAALVAAGRGEVPDVLAVRCGPLGTEILLDRPAPEAPGLFDAVDDGRTWRLDPAADSDEVARLAGDQPPPLPALVSVGATPDGEVLIDLAACGSLALIGDAESAAATFRSIALELATAPWAAGVDLVLLGWDDRLAALERVRTLDPSDALAQLRGCVRPGGPHPVGLAAAVAGDSTAPTVVLVGAGALPADVLDELVDLARSGHRLVVVAADGSATARSVLHLALDGTARLEPLGLSLDQLADPTVTDAVVELLSDAATPGTDVPAEDRTLAQPVVDDVIEPALEETTRGDGQEAMQEPEPLVWVRVLGPVDVDWRKPATRPQLTELVAYIATHPPQVGSDRVKCALWPVDLDDERFGERSPNTLWALVSKARVALGTGPAGEDLLSTRPGNRYELSPLVACDWTRFEALRKAAADHPDRAVVLLREALSLVRGRPFQDLPRGAYSWVGLDRLDSDIEAAVAEAAGVLVAAALAGGELDTARFAVQQGRLGAPHSESLIRGAMQVAAAAGDNEGLDRALRDARRLAQLLDPTGEPEPETLRLYEELRPS